MSWILFVLGLLSLMVSCGYSAVLALGSPNGYPLAALSIPLFFLVIGLDTLLASVLALFLFCLLVQHIYFMYEGITTLEYIKDQAAGFPALPPRGWREAVSHGECYACGDVLEMVEEETCNDGPFCSVCQSDVGKAGLEFLSCGTCDNVNVCPLCFRMSNKADVPIITYRVASFRRQAEALGQEVAVGQLFEARQGSLFEVRQGSSGMLTTQPSRISAFSAGQRSPRLGGRRRTFTAAVADAEGHAGDEQPPAPPRAAVCCCGSRGRWKSSRALEQDESNSSSDETSSSSAAGL